MAISSGRNTSDRNGRGIIKSPFTRFYQIQSTPQEAWVAPLIRGMGGTVGSWFEDARGRAAHESACIVEPTRPGCCHDAPRNLVD